MAVHFLLNVIVVFVVPQAGGGITSMRILRRAVSSFKPQPDRVTLERFVQRMQEEGKV